MGQDDWYQARRWTPDNKEAFLRRARRSREHRFHYFLRQAAVLREEGLNREALELLDELRAYQPKHHWHMRTELARATLLDALGDQDGALEAFRASFELMKAAMRAGSTHRTDAALEFAAFVVRHDAAALLPEVEDRLREFTPVVTTPLDAFNFSAACAYIFAAKNEHQAAAEYARRALAATERTNSGWPRHPGLGLVVSPDPATLSRLRDIERGPNAR